MRALTPARLAHAAQVSPLPLSRRPNILSPTTLWAPGIAFAVASACSVWSRDQGFAMSGQARRATPPKRVRYPTGCSFASGCSPPRLATTQLPSATCVTTSHRLDFHLPDKTTSRTHPPRHSRGSPAYASMTSPFLGNTTTTFNLLTPELESFWLGCCIERRWVIGNLSSTQTGTPTLRHDVGGARCSWFVLR